MVDARVSPTTGYWIRSRCQGLGVGEGVRTWVWFSRRERESVGGERVARDGGRVGRGPLRWFSGKVV